MTDSFSWEKFWSIRPEVGPGAVVRYSELADLRETKTESISAFMSHVRGRLFPKLFEVLGETTNLFFVINRKRRADPDDAVATRVLEAVLGFLRAVFGTSIVFAVSQAHRPSRIVFHIVCPLLFAKRQFIKQIVGDLDFGLDLSLYEPGDQAVHPAMTVGERAEYRPSLSPVAPYRGVFSDHIIQAISSQATEISYTTIPRIMIGNYMSSGVGLIEDLIATVDFREITGTFRYGLLARLKKEDLRRLFDYKLRQTTAELNEIWLSLDPEQSCGVLKILEILTLQDITLTQLIQKRHFPALRDTPSQDLIIHLSRRDCAYLAKLIENDIAEASRPRRAS